MGTLLNRIKISISHKSQNEKDTLDSSTCAMDSSTSKNSVFLHHPNFHRNRNVKGHVASNTCPTRFYVAILLYSTSARRKSIIPFAAFLLVVCWTLLRSNLFPSSLMIELFQPLNSKTLDQQKYFHDGHGKLQPMDVLTYGRRAPTGDPSLYDETKECATRMTRLRSLQAQQQQSTDGIIYPCLIYYPFVDLEEKGKHPQQFHKKKQDHMMYFHEYKRHAIVTRTGYKRKIDNDNQTHVNQDRSFIIAPFPLPYLTQQQRIRGQQSKRQTEQFSSARTDKSPTASFLMGIFDGHGEYGHAVSQFVSMIFPIELETQFETWIKTQKRSNSTSEDEFWKEILKKTFLQIDQSIPSFFLSSGCTASIILQLHNKLYMANVGDSLSFVATYHTFTRTVSIIYQSKPHKPNLMEERTRIESMGGKILFPPSPYSSRVIIPMPLQPFDASLAMSRSLGDREAKAVGVIADPTVDVLDITSLGKVTINTSSDFKNDSNMNTVELFAFVGSDGLFDKVPYLQVANILAESIYGDKENNNTDLLLLEACKNLIMTSSNLWMMQYGVYRDDISIAVSKIRFP